MSIGRLAALICVVAFTGLDSSQAQNVPTPTGRCVYNCDTAPAPSATSSGGSAVGNQMGYELGRAIGRSLSNSNSNGTTYTTRPEDPNSASVRAVRGQLDQWADDDPPVVSTSPARGTAKQSCNVCSVNRDRCTTGCDSVSTNREKLQCVNRCNENYPCVMGSDCN